MKKRVLSLALVGMMLTGLLAGCGGGSASGSGSAGGSGSGSTPPPSGDGELKVALSMACRDQFLSTLETATIEAAKQAGVDLATFDANNDVATQISHVQTCASAGYDGMIVNLVNTDSASELVTLAKKADMKLVFVNRMPSDVSILSKDVVYCGSNEKEAGQMQGKYLADYFKEKGQTDVKGILIMGILGLDNTNNRTAGVKEALTEGGLNVEWVYEDTAEFDRAKAMDKMTQILGDSSKKYDFIVANADDMALGVIEAINTTLGKVTVPIVGIDGGKTGCEAVKAGNMAFTVFQNAKGQGSGSIDCVVKMCKGEEMSDLDNFINWIPFEPVTAENVDDYYNA